MFKHKTLPVINTPNAKCILTPMNENKQVLRATNSKEKQSSTSRIQQFVSPFKSPDGRLERLLDDNQKLIEQNTRLLEELTMLREQNPAGLEEKLEILLVENERLTTLLGQQENIDNDYKCSKKRIAELLLKIKELTKYNDALSERLNMAERQLELQGYNSRSTQKLQQDLVDSHEKIVQLVNSNDQLNQILEERLQQLDNINDLSQQQKEYYEQQLSNLKKNNNSELQSLYVQSKFLENQVMDLTTQLKRSQDEKSAILKEKLGLLDQVSLLSNTDRKNQNTSQTLQEQVKSLTQELDWYKEELKRANQQITQSKEFFEGEVSSKEEQAQLMLVQLQKCEHQLNVKEFEVENLKTTLKTQSEQIQILSDQLQSIYKSASKQVHFNEQISQQHFHVLQNENHHLKQQVQQLCQQINQQGYQIQMLSAQLEASQQQVQQQQLQISQQNQRFVQYQREWEKKEHLITEEAKKYKTIQTQQTFFNPLKEIDTNLTQSAIDSPFRVFKLQNFYGPEGCENFESHSIL